MNHLLLNIHGFDSIDDDLPDEQALLDEESFRELMADDRRAERD